MIMQNGRYLLSLNDWINVCKYFKLDTTKTKIVHIPQLTFIQYDIVDIDTNRVVLSFYDHDGLFRIKGDYTFPISSIFDRKAPKPSEEIMKYIQSISTHRPTFADKITRKK